MMLYFSASQLTNYFTGFQPELRDRGSFLDADHLHRNTELGQSLFQ
jgi:hypothetical protein